MTAEPALRLRWVRDPWYVPQASSFWRRDVFDEFGLLRDDLHFIFDTEFGVRLALGGLRPRLLDTPLAVRYVHDEAKSADASRFVAEWEPVADELERKIVWWESALYFTVWAPLQEIRKRLGLVDLRKRWFGGRFARV